MEGQRSQLKVLEDHLLAQDGVTKKTKEKLQEAQAALKDAHLNYLRQSCLLRLLKTHSRDNELLQECIGREEAATCQFKDILSIDNHHWKRLQPTTKEWTSKRSIAINKVSELAAEECQQLASWLKEQQGSSKPLSEAQLQELKSSLKEKCDTIEQNEKALVEIRHKIHSKKLELYKELTECCNILLHLISNYQLKCLAPEMETKVSYLTSKSQALDLKLKVIKLQLMVATYTPDKNAALREIRSFLDSAQQQIELQLVDTQQSLEHYQTLGPDFVALAEEYHQLMAEIENKKWALNELGKNTHQSSS